MRRLAAWGFSFAAALTFSAYLLSGERALILAGAAFLAFILCLFLKTARRKLAAIILAGITAGFAYLPLYSFLFAKEASLPMGEELLLEAEATDFPAFYSRGAALNVSIITETGRVNAVVYLYDGEAYAVKPGDRVRFTAMLFAAGGKTGSESEEYFSHTTRVGAGSVKGFEITVSASAPQFRYLHKYAAKAVKDAIKAVYPEKEYPLALALLTGDKSALKMDRALTSDLQRSGIYHVATVSGMHVSILASFLLIIIPKKSKAALTIIPLLVLFAAVAGFTPSVTRAVIMELFVIIAPLVGREEDKLTSIAAALIFILAVDPMSATHAGFQLSFASVLGITLISPRILNAFCSLKLYNSIRKPKRKGRIAKLAGGFAVTLGAMAATIPLSALHFGYFSLAALPANLLISFAVAPAFILSAVSALAGAVFLPAGVILAKAGALILKYVASIARIFAGGVLSAVYVDNTVLIMWLIFAYAAVIAAIIKRRELKSLIVPLCAAAVSLSLILVASAIRTDIAEGFTLTALDVGQGQCVVVTSGPLTAVIDCGSISFDRSGELCASFINGLGRDGIDILCLTHYHSDHTSGAKFLLERMNVKALAIPLPCDGDSAVHASLVSAAEKNGTDVIYVSEDLFCDFFAADLTLFAPVGGETENERCVTALFSDSGFDALVTADISGEIECELAAAKRLPDIECLVVSHHGSRYSSDKVFLAAVKPEIGIISVGRENSFGHPAEETLRRLSEAGVQIYRTDIFGNITVSSKESAAYG